MSPDNDTKEWISMAVESAVSKSNEAQTRILSAIFQEQTAKVGTMDRELGEVSTKINDHIDTDSVRWKINWSLWGAIGTAMLGVISLMFKELWDKLTKMVG